MKTTNHLTQEVLQENGFSYDSGKRFYTRSRSECHNAKFEQRTLLNNKPLKKPFSSYSYEDQEKIIYRYFCSECNEVCKVNTEFINE